MKELNEYKNIWVYLETKDGELKMSGLSCSTPAVCLPMPQVKSWWAC